MRSPVAGFAVAALLIVATAGTSLAQGDASPSAHPGDGAPDPAGRIVFGKITNWDDFYGPVAALYAIDRDGSDLVQLTDGGSAFPDWSPDGTRIAFTLGQPDGSWQVATMNPDGSDVRVLTSGAGVSEAPSWSPDGSWIAYGHSPTLPTDDTWHTVLYRMDADGSNQELLGDPDTFDVEPRISSDGTNVLFERLTFENGGQQQTLMIRDLTSGEERAMAAAGSVVEHARWSPDGNWIVYQTPTGQHHQVERVAADGSGEPLVLRAASATETAFRPSYSPDGSSILFGCMGATETATCLMHADGSDVRILVDEPGAEENHFAWGVAAP